MTDFGPPCYSELLFSKASVSLLTVSLVIRGTFYQLKLLAQSQSWAISFFRDLGKVIHAFIAFRPDYCNFPYVRSGLLSAQKCCCSPTSWHKCVLKSLFLFLNVWKINFFLYIRAEMFGAGLHLIMYVTIFFMERASFTQILKRLT